MLFRSCLESGMDDFLSKPFRRSDLVTTVRKWVAPGSAPTTEENRSPLDQASVAELRDIETQSGQPILDVLVDSFLSSADESVRKFTIAMDVRDFDGLVAVAHRLTGGSGAVGALRAAEAFSELERAGRTRDLAGCATAVANVEVVLARTRPALEAERARSVGTGPGIRHDASEPGSAAVPPNVESRTCPEWPIASSTMEVVRSVGLFALAVWRRSAAAT